MGIGGISLPQLLIILLIVVVIFGTTKLTSIGKDLGGAVRGFRKAMEDEDDPARIASKSDDASTSTTTQKVESKQQ